MQWTMMSSIPQLPVGLRSKDHAHVNTVTWMLSPFAIACQSHHTSVIFGLCLELCSSLPLYIISCHNVNFPPIRPPLGGD